MYNVAHVGMVVQDAERSTEFYTQVLGCQIVDRHEDERIQLVFLQTNDLVIELVKHKQREEAERMAGVIDHIAFYVDDLEKEMARLKGKVEFLYDAPILTGNKKIIFFTGPEGERLELVQLLDQ